MNSDGQNRDELPKDEDAAPRDTHAAPGDPVAETDLLLARAVAGDRGALAEVRARAAHDPALLEELAMWQADELRLARVARELDLSADRVELPRTRWFGGSDARAPRVFRAGLGWAVAATIALAWVAQAVVPRDTNRSASVAGISAGFESADDAFDAYLAKAREEGLVHGEVAPPTLLGSRELGNGQGFEVVIIRQVIERRIAPEMYRVAPMGETGRLRPVVIRPRTDLVQ
jgi:hypothetical protein